MQTGIKSFTKLFSKVKGTEWSFLLFQSTCSCLCPDSAVLCAWAILRTLRALPALTVPSWAPPTCPQPRTPMSGPAPAMPWQGWSPAPHRPTRGPTSWPGLSLSLSQRRCPVPGLGLLPCPLTALLRAGMVGQVLAARSCPDGPRGAPDGSAPIPRSLPAPAVPCSF